MKTPQDAIEMLNECVTEAIDESHYMYLPPYIQESIHFCNARGIKREFNSCFMLRIFYFYDYIIDIKRPMVESGKFVIVKNLETEQPLLEEEIQKYEHKILSMYYEKAKFHKFEPFPKDHILFCFQFLSFIHFQLEAQIVLKRIVPDNSEEKAFTFLINLLEKRSNLILSANMNFNNAYGYMVAHIEDIVTSFTMLEDEYVYDQK